MGTVVPFPGLPGRLYADSKSKFRKPCPHREATKAEARANMIVSVLTVFPDLLCSRIYDATAKNLTGFPPGRSKCIQPVREHSWTKIGCCPRRRLLSQGRNNQKSALPIGHPSQRVYS